MKPTRVILMFGLALLVLGLARSANAQRWDWDDEGTAAQFRSFDAFLHNHPWIAKKLWEKPERINDRDFVGDNREIKQWLEDYPDAGQAFRDNPRGFMERERDYQMYGADLESHDRRHRELASFDWFLDGHPEIRHDLTHRPGLVNNGEYLEHHPTLRAFLDRHPDLRDELQDHPREFMEREARYDRRD